MREPMLTHLVDYLRRTGDREFLDLALNRAMKGLKNDGDSIDGIAMHFGLSTRSVYRRVGIGDDKSPARLAALLKIDWLRRVGWDAPDERGTASIAFYPDSSSPSQFPPCRIFGQSPPKCSRNRCLHC